MFTISTNRAHQCMPVCADMDLPNRYWRREIDQNCHEARRARIVELTVIEKAIVNAIPKSEWHGTKRWARAFGVI